MANSAVCPLLRGQNVDMVGIVKWRQDNSHYIAGFSIAEILVVAGIIVLLLALLIPVLKAAR